MKHFGFLSWLSISVSIHPQLALAQADPPLAPVVWTDVAFDRSARQVTPEFFGLHLYAGVTPADWPAVPFKTWRLHDAGTRWDELQPERDRWNFDHLDALVDLAEQQDVEVILVLGQTPAWASARPADESPYGISGLPAEPARIEDWTAYVRTIASRYRGRIHYYELWNEANFRWFYTGSIPNLLELAAAAYTTIEQVDPDAQVISPSVIAGDYPSLERSGADWLKEYFALGGDRYTDIVGAHFYLPRDLPPEWIVWQIHDLRQVMAASGQAHKPLWNTETGFGRVDTYPVEGDRAVGYVGRAHILQWAAGIDRFQWYSWRNFNFVGLRMTERDGSVTVAGEAFGAIQDWLLGSTLGLCQISSDRTRLCPMARANGDRGWIVWNPNRTVQVEVPAGLQANWGQRLAGESFPIAPAQRIEVGEIPVLIERRSSRVP